MRYHVLDHGYVEFIEAYGTGKAGVEEISMMNQEVAKPVDYECGIIEAARQSTQGSFRGWDDGDAKLLKRLWLGKPEEEGEAWPDAPRHASPFEFAGMIIEVQAPILVFREWHRHRTQGYNEMSARYAPLPDLYYHADLATTLERARAGLKSTNKQTSGTASVVDEEAISSWLKIDEGYSVALEEHYQKGLAAGVPKELARKKTPVDHYSRMRAVGNLRNWLAFLSLRLDAGVQWETREYAQVVDVIVRETFPRTWDLFTHEKGG